MRATLVLVAALALLAPAAHAATGDLTLHQCLAGWASPDPGCSEQDLVDGAQHVVVAPDGRDVYIISTNIGTGAIVGFRRDASTGDLTFSQCFIDAKSPDVTGCTHVATGSVLAFPLSLALSPDGSNLYVYAGTYTSISGYNSAGVTTFNRDTTSGALSYQGCIADPLDAADRKCTTTFAGLLGTEGGITVTPDGKDVIVAEGGYRHTVTWIPRDTTTGALNSGGANCLNDLAPGTDACGTSNKPLSDLAAVAVDPSGKNVYVSSWSTGLLAHLTRDTTTGALSFAECYANSASGDASTCSAIGTTAVGYATGLAVSPDGKTLAVGGAPGVSNWTLDGTTGIPTYTQCFGEGGCTPTPTGGNAMGGTRSVAFSPDDLNLYSMSYSKAALSTFTRDSAGALTFATCVAQSVSPGCPSVIADQNEFSQPFAVAVSPDNLDVYTVANSNHGSLLHFQREVPGGRPAGGGGGGGTTPPPGGGTTTPPPTGATTGPKLADFVTLPRTRSCARRARLRIRLHVPTSAKVKRIEIRVNGRRVAVAKGRKLRSTIVLKALPAGVVNVSVRVVLKNGKTVTGKRRYPACKKP